MITEAPPAHDVLLRSALRRAPGVIFVLDALGTTTFIEGEGLSHLGWIPQEVIGQKLIDLCDCEDIRRDVRRVLGGESFVSTGRIRSLHYSIAYSPIEDAGHKCTGAAGFATDITEQRQAEKERDRLLITERKAHATAERAVRARDEFMSVASHELRTPIAALNLLTDSLHRHASGESVEVPRSTFELLHAQVRRLVALIEPLMDLARIENQHMALTIETSDLVSITKSAIEQLQPEFDRTRTPLALHAPDSLIGKWDRSRICQMIVNLLSNAIKYGDERPVEVHIEQGELNRVRLSVRDLGMGIPRDRLDRIFDRFERAVADSHIGGLGLGLYIARQIAEAHGGTIQVESTLRVGSTFVVDLPIESGPS